MSLEQNLCYCESEPIELSEFPQTDITVMCGEIVDYTIEEPTRTHTLDYYTTRCQLQFSTTDSMLIVDQGLTPSTASTIRVDPGMSVGSHTPLLTITLPNNSVSGSIS